MHTVQTRAPGRAGAAANPAASSGGSEATWPSTRDTARSRAADDGDMNTRTRRSGSNTRPHASSRFTGWPIHVSW